jgi:hypothetical protein
MTDIKKLTRSCCFEQAENQITQQYSTTITFRMKAEFILLTVWVPVEWRIT